MKNVIEIKNLKKVFKQHTSLKNLIRGKRKRITALNRISVDIREGEIFGLLGPNGAGKTTLIKMLATLILPTEGSATVCGYDVVKDAWHVKNSIGLIHSDERSFFWRLTARQNLEFFAALYQLPSKVAKERIEEQLALVGLEEHANTWFQNYSTGMKQRLAIARGLLSRPKILFMDEPMRSIDPISTHKIREFIRNEALEHINGAIVIATNRLDEATSLCDRVGIFNNGNLIACGRTKDINLSVKDSIQYELEINNINDEVINRISKMEWVLNCEKKVHLNGKMDIVISLASEEEGLHHVLEEIMRSKGYIQKCKRKQPSFEEAFVSVIQEFDKYQDKNGTN
jgi:ABC-2 type transport system ATP-binding protein